MNKKSFLSPLRGAKRASGREVGTPRRSQKSLGREWFQWLEARQLMSGMTIETLSYSASIPVQLTDISPAAPFTPSIPTFNPALGTLAAVGLTVTLDGNLSGSVTNEGPDPTTFTIGEETTASAFVDTSATSVNPIVFPQQTFTNLAPGGTGTLGPIATTQGASAVYTSGNPLFNDFIGGTGTVGLDLSTNTVESITGSGNILANATTTVGATATVVYVYCVGSVSVSGNVYDDVDGTGALQAGDLPIPGTTLTLLNSSGAVVNTTQTGPLGAYSFTTDSTGAPLQAGTYSVVETQPFPYLQGTNTVGTVNGVTDGNEPVHDTIGSIVLTSGQDSINNNFGEILPVAVSGTVYHDVFNAGVLAPGDPPIPDVTVNLFDSAGLVASMITDASGNFDFTTSSSGAPLSPNTYTLVEIQPAGFLQGTNTVGTVNGVTVGDQPVQDVIGAIALTSGQDSIHNNFGELTPTPPPPAPAAATATATAPTAAAASHQRQCDQCPAVRRPPPADPGRHLVQHAVESRVGPERRQLPDLRPDQLEEPPGDPDRVGHLQRDDRHGDLAAGRTPQRPPILSIHHQWP